MLDRHYSARNPADQPAEYGRPVGPQLGPYYIGPGGRVVSAVAERWWLTGLGHRSLPPSRASRRRGASLMEADRCLGVVATDGSAAFCTKARNRSANASATFLARWCAKFVTSAPSVCRSVAVEEHAAPRRELARFSLTVTRMTVTSRLRQIATSKGLTLAELSRRSGVCATVVYACGRGAVPGPSARERIAKALQTAPSELWPIDPPVAGSNG